MRRLSPVPVPPALHVVSVATLVAALVAAGGCVTGERPSFSTSPNAPGEMTGDPAIDAVLSLLDEAENATFQADYTILTRFGDRQTDASVVQLAGDDRTITIGDVEFRFDGGSTQTCEVGTDECMKGIHDQRVSDVQVTHRFYAAEAAIRLRRDAQAAIGDASARTTELAGQPATCVSVPVSGGVVDYCALDDGVLALDDDADVHIELTSYDGDVENSSTD